MKKCYVILMVLTYLSPVTGSTFYEKYLKTGTAETPKKPSQEAPTSKKPSQNAPTSDKIKAYLCFKGDFSLAPYQFKAGKFGTTFNIQMARELSDNVLAFVKSDLIEHGRHAAWACKYDTKYKGVVSIVNLNDNKLSYIGTGEKPSENIRIKYMQETNQKTLTCKHKEGLELIDCVYGE